MERAKYLYLCATSPEHSIYVVNASPLIHIIRSPNANQAARIVTAEDLETFDKKLERTKQISLLFPSQEVRPFGSLFIIRREKPNLEHLLGRDQIFELSWFVFRVYVSLPKPFAHYSFSILLYRISRSNR